MPHRLPLKRQKWLSCAIWNSSLLFALYHQNWNFPCRRFEFLNANYFRWITLSSRNICCCKFQIEILLSMNKIWRRMLISADYFFTCKLKLILFTQWWKWLCLDWANDNAYYWCACLFRCWKDTQRRGLG